MVGKTGDELDYLNNEDSPRKNSGHKMASWEKSWALFMIDGDLPSGKPTVCYGKPPSLTGKSTINRPCSIAMLVYQRVLL